MFNKVTLKVQDISGNWFDIKTLSLNNDQYTLSQMKQTQKMFGGKRVKAVDAKGNLLDILD